MAFPAPKHRAISPENRALAGAVASTLEYYRGLSMHVLGAVTGVIEEANRRGEWTYNDQVLLMRYYQEKQEKTSLKAVWGAPHVPPLCSPIEHSALVSALALVAAEKLRAGTFSDTTLEQMSAALGARVYEWDSFADDIAQDQARGLREVRRPKRGKRALMLELREEEQL